MNPHTSRMSAAPTMLAMKPSLPLWLVAVYDNRQPTRDLNRSAAWKVVAGGILIDVIRATARPPGISAPLLLWLLLL
jgi:hypothetical protein